MTQEKETDTSQIPKTNRKGHNVRFSDNNEVIEIENDNKGRKVDSIRAKKYKSKFVLFFTDLFNIDSEIDDTPEIIITDTEGKDHIYVDTNDNN